MSELTKKRVHWKEYNGEELIHDEDVDILTSADAVTFDDGETMQYKYSQGQFVSPSDMGDKSNLSTTNKSTLVDAINEVKTAATSNESSIDSLTNRVTTSESDIDSLETRMSTAENDIDSLETRMSTAESDIDNLETRMSTAENDIDNLENRVTPISLGGTGATTASGALANLEITATASELNTLDGITATTTELNYVEGVTSNIQTQLDDKASSTHSHSATDITSGTLPIARGGTGATSESGAISNFKTAIVDLIYPVGSYYWSSSSTSPDTLFGGTWTQVKDRFVLAAGSSYSVGSTGGEATHTLTVSEMPKHTHSYYHEGAGAKLVRTDLSQENVVYWGKAMKSTEKTGGSQAHNNMPPYIVAYCWRRTA